LNHLARTSISVDSKIAEELTNEAIRLKKTVYGFTNQSLEAILKVCKQGGTLDELYPSWKMNKMERDIAAPTLLTPNLIEWMILQASKHEEEQLHQAWFRAGKELGTYVKLDNPSVEELTRLIDDIQKAIPVKSVKLYYNASEDTFVWRLVSLYSQDFNVCSSYLLEGVLSAFSLVLTGRTVSGGVLELRAKTEK
jgi:hypothetical protein